ncbi:MAG: MBL fold metallo-hydrolase, partial [Candidatus Micrarchaeota archaeon]|nr:MBL fold metallo-hydrolase [Candidatus Micrarchaeota archaeon]
MNTTVFGGVRITLFGHSSVCLEYGGKNIYIDPFVIDRGAKPADLILHTHSHFDHCAPAPSITTSNTLVIGKGCKHPGRPVEIGDKFSAAGATIEVVPAYNTN